MIETKCLDMKQLTIPIFEMSNTPMKLVGMFSEQATSVITLGLSS